MVFMVQHGLNLSCSRSPLEDQWYIENQWPRCVSTLMPRGLQSVSQLLGHV